MISNSPLISLCMIAKNEEENIERALMSSWRLVDEIILIDTGSTDNTVKIAQSFGAKVYYKKWQNDFSSVKNFALKNASGRWILFLDADEEIREIKREKLHANLYNSKEIGFYISIINLADSGNSIKSKAIRLFRNDPAFKFQGRIHEEIISSMQKSQKTPALGEMDFKIYHYGYLKKEVEKRNKIERNIRLLKQDKDKNSSRYCLYLGMEYLRNNKLQFAEKWLKKGLKKVNENSEYKHMLYIKVIKCLLFLEKYDDGIYFCQQGLQLFPDFADINFYWGVFLLKQRKYQEAKHIFLKGLKQGESTSKYTSELGCGSYLNYYYLGVLEEICLNVQKAYEYYFDAFKLQPENKRFLQAYLRMSIVNDLDIIELFKNITTISSLALQEAVEILYELGKFEYLKFVAVKYDGLLYSSESKHIIAVQVLAEENLELAKKSKTKKLDRVERDIMLFAWLIALIKEDRNFDERFTNWDNDDLLLLKNIRSFYNEGKLEDLNFSFDSIHKITAFLKLLEATAFKNNKFLLKKLLTFLTLSKIPDFLPLVAKIINRQGREQEARDILSVFPIDNLDAESCMLLAALLVKNDNLRAFSLAKELLKKGEINCRVHLTALEACIQEAMANCSKLNEKKILLKEIPRIL